MVKPLVPSNFDGFY